MEYSDYQTKPGLYDYSDHGEHHEDVVTDADGNLLEGPHD
jgi:hypothetical protein